MNAAWKFPLAVFALVFCAGSLRGQMLILDRSAGAKPGTPRIGRTQTSGYVGDYFRVGAPGELWVVSSARGWVVPEARCPKDAKVGDLFEKISFAGGIEAPPPPAGQPDCDCHNLLLLQTGVFKRGKDEPDTDEIRAEKLSSNLWQIDFRRLNWTVPGATNIQFGVAGGERTANGGSCRLLTAAAETDTPHQLRAFNSNGKLEGAYADQGLRPNAAIRVQIWGHLKASISLHRVLGINGTENRVKVTSISNAFVRRVRSALD